MAALSEYENSMFLELMDDDGLFVTAKGLSIERVITNFLKIHCVTSDPSSISLVLVINTTDQEEDYILDELKSSDVPLPKVITTEFSSSERESVYLSGGVLFVTSRILVVDMLTKRLPIHLVTGIVVYRAHKIIESCQEAFILRLYRENNKTGFIKAFSDNPQAFTNGFFQVEKVMKNLFVRKLYLWPRFHATVSAFLEKHKPEVIELHLHLTPSMLAIQTAVLDLTDTCLKELKRANPTLDADDLTVENSISKSFDKILRFQLNPVWHQLGNKTKQLVADLKVLRLILLYLTQYDCITFYNFLESLRASQRDVKNHSLWMFMDAADSLFVHAKDRVVEYTERKNKKMKGEKTKQKDDKNLSSDIEKEQKEELVLEESPKWKLLADVLDEIERDDAKNDTKLGPGHVLIAAYDERTCSQLRDYLCDGGEAVLKHLYNKLIKNPTTVAETTETASFSGETLRGYAVADVAKKADVPSSRQRKARAKAGDKGNAKGKVAATKNTVNTDDSNDGTIASTTQLFKGSRSNVILRPGEEDNKGEEEGSPPIKLLSSRVVIIHPLTGCSDRYSLLRTLCEVEPRYVVLYDAQMQFIRQLEVYKASRPGIPLRVYFLIYTGSVEEQKYLTTLRKEKEAFEALIKDKGTMVVPEEREGRTSAAMMLSRDPSKATDAVSTRKAGTRDGDNKTPRKVIVDMREFRSELPSLIHRRGIDIEPVTLEVGDYILTPDMCVERKSIGDLIGSLNNGRLYNQAVSMTRFYKRPILLIEFDPNKSFSLQLRILWCHSPYATAELFDDLKTNYPEPDANTAMAVGSDPTAAAADITYNIGPQDFILKLPGINFKNYRFIMQNVESVQELFTLSQERLAAILGNAGSAKQLWEFIHADNKPHAKAPTSLNVKR
ncbi:DNA repair endonuclease XPF [Desmophyllum pertusum]|uniref:DNA repair endonuclease XPF n=1 Tax=Desmophyllum pertusum TaxID=174260 RepID=A0A9X0CV61_9CNID|nr:DNA repair endonuclease XPF [Desmophyllum pertusum]